MRIQRALTPILICLAASPAVAATAQCTAHSTEQQTHLVELYTSEGCSSCPPADRWLRAMDASDEVVPLELHVDYWDSLGWPDPYDDHRFSVRQRQLAARSTRHVAYTPEVALDGREWRAWSHAALPGAISKARIKLSLNVQTGHKLHVSLRAIPVDDFDASGYKAWFAVTEDGLVSNVKAGENSGSVLRHNHTVRAFAGPLALNRASADLSLPAELKRSRSAVVAFVQNPQTGDIAQVVRQPLATCTH